MADNIPLPSPKNNGDKMLSPSKIPLPPSSCDQGDVQDPKFLPPPPKSTESAPAATEKTSIGKPTLVRNRLEAYKKEVTKKKSGSDKSGSNDTEDKSKVVDDLFKEFMSQKLSDAEKMHRANIISRLQKKQAEAKVKEKQVEAEMKKASEKFKEVSPVNTCSSTATVNTKKAPLPKIASTVSQVTKKIIAGAKAAKVPSVLENIKMSYDDEDLDVHSSLKKSETKNTDNSKHKKHKKHKHKEKHKSKSKGDKNLKKTKERDKNENGKVKDLEGELKESAKEAKTSNTIPGDLRIVESQSLSSDTKVTVSPEKDDSNVEPAPTLPVKGDSRTIQIIPRSVQERAKKENLKLSSNQDFESDVKNSDELNSSDKQITVVKEQTGSKEDITNTINRNNDSVKESENKTEKDSDESKKINSGNKERENKTEAEQHDTCDIDITKTTNSSNKESVNETVQEDSDKSVIKLQKPGAIKLGIGLKISASSASLISLGANAESNKKPLEDGMKP